MKVCEEFRFKGIERNSSGGWSSLESAVLTILSQNEYYIDTHCSINRRVHSEIYVKAFGVLRLVLVRGR
jgi:hypothetical protein